MSKDYTMDIVRAAQMAVMQPEVEKKLAGCATRYMQTTDLKRRASAKREFYEIYAETYNEAAEQACDPKALEEVLKFQRATEESFERNSIAAVDIGEGLAEIAFIKAVRTVAKVEDIDFSVGRTYRDILLEERAPHLARPRQQETHR